MQGNKNYFPNKYYTPYMFMEQFNEVLKTRYDIKVVEVRYVVSKSRDMKHIDEQFAIGDFQIEQEYNNVFDLND